MNSNLFANPQLFQAYQQDPSLAYGQALMQQGASTAPVRSPLEGVARALTGVVGGFTQSKARDKYEGENEKYRHAMAEALKGGDILAALQASDSPQLQQMAMEARVKQAMEKPANSFKTLTDDEERALGLPTAGTYQRDSTGKVDVLQAPPAEFKIGDKRDYQKDGLRIYEEYAGNGQWKPLGSGPAFAPPNQVNVNTKTESEFAKAFGKGEGEAAAALANDVGNSAQSALQNLDALKQAYAELQAAGGDVGLLAGLQTKATQLMQAFGFDPKMLGLPENAGPAEQINAISNQLALQMRNPSGGAGMPGAMSDADRTFLRDTVANLGNSPQGFSAKIEAAAKIKQRELEMSVLWNSGQYEQNQEGFRKFKQDWAKYTRENPLFDTGAAAPEKSAPQGGPQPGYVEGGYRFKGGDPADQKNWEKVDDTRGRVP